MEFEKLYMFNPFTIQNADSRQISETYSNLQREIIENADTGFQISKNIEIYANMNYLIGEMIARIQQEYDTLKNNISIVENKQIYMQRKQWQETNKEKAPAMSYFEGVATRMSKDDINKLADKECSLARFKNAYKSIEEKLNALKKKMESIKYEEF